MAYIKVSDTVVKSQQTYERTFHKAELELEKAQLQKRIAEIDDLLSVFNE